MSNNCIIIAIPNLYVVETVDSIKKADTLDKACKAVGRKEPLRVFVQVNTSEEDGKFREKETDWDLIMDDSQKWSGSFECSECLQAYN